MTEEKTFKGFWNLSLNDGNPITLPGILSFSPELGGELELVCNRDLWLDFSNIEMLETITGATDSWPVTLLDCYRTQLRSDDLMILNFRVDVVIVGAQLDSRDKVKLDSFDVEFTNLAEWTGWQILNGFHTIERDRIVIPTASPEPVRIAETEEWTANLFVSYVSSHPELRGSSGTHSLTIRPRVQIQFQPRFPLQFSRNLDCVRSMQTFLSFATGRGSYLASMAGVVDLGEERVTVWFYFRQFLGEVLESDTLSNHEMLLTLNNLGTNPSVYVNAWIERGNRLQPVYDGFTSLQYSPRVMIEHRFLSLVQVCEDLFAWRSKKKIHLEEQLKTFISSSLLACKDQLNCRGWVRAMEVLLGKRKFQGMRTGISVVIVKWQQLGKRERRALHALCQRISDSRHVYSHGRRDPEQKAASGYELIALCSILGWLIEWMLLIEIGFEVEAARKLIFRQRS